MSLEIAWRLFWRPEKASLFSFGKIAFSTEKAITFKLGKIASSGRQDARNCVRMFWRREKACPFRFGKSLFELKKAISFRFGKIAFSGRQAPRNCVNIVLAPCKSVPFQIRIIRLFSWYSDFYQVRKIRFFRSPKRSNLRQGCSDALKRRPLSDSKNRLFSWKSCLSGSEISLF